VGKSPDDQATHEDGHVPAAAATAPLGERVGRYQLVESIGEGAMGVVYRARDPQLGRAVAIKVLRGDHTALRAARLLREAQAMAQLSHPNLVTVFDAGQDGERVFLAMELVDGTSLRAWFETASLTWRDRLRGVIDAGRGLVAAHDAGVVHRDFKPENVLVDGNGRVKVTDFGLARAEMTSAPIDDSVPMHETMTGSVLGTPAYMAPEQHAGKGADTRSDQFAFAVTAWEAIWSRRPFSAESLAALTFAIRDGAIEAPPVVRGVPPRLEEILRRALAVDPAARWPSVAALLAALEAELAPPKRSRWPLAAALGFVVAGVGGFVAWRLLTTPGAPAPYDFGVEHYADASPDLPTEIVEVIQAHQQELQACYDEAKQKKRSGTVTLRFNIAQDGKVRSVEIEHDEFPGSSIARCAAAAAWKWEFPPGTPADVRAPLVLGTR